MKLFIYKLLGIRKYPVHPAARFITPRSRVSEVDLQNFGRASYSSKPSSVQGAGEMVAELQKYVCPKKQLRLPTRVLWFELADTQLPLWFGISFATLVLMFGVTGVFSLHAMQLREIAKQNARTENNLSAFAHAKNITIAQTNILARTLGQAVSNSPKPVVARQQRTSTQKVTTSFSRPSLPTLIEPTQNINDKSENLNLPAFSGQVLGTSIQTPLSENDIRAMVDNYLREKNISSGLIQNQNGNTTAVVGNTPIVTYVPPVPSQGFGGASVAGFTTLSAEHFNTSNANITSSLTVPGTASFTGSVSFAGVSYSWPTVVGTSGQVLSSNGLGQLSWVDIAVAGATWSTSTNGTIYYTGGNVGVGTSTPVLPLQVSATGPYSGTANGVAQGTSWAYLWTASGNNPAIIWNSSANRLRFGPEIGVGSGFSEKMTITTAGNVGIGTTSPIAKLDVWGNLNVGTSSTPALFVDTANGRVGIGASSPSAPLTVVGQTAGSAGLLITSGNTNLGYANAGGIQFGYGAAGSALNTVRVARIMALTQSGGGGDLYFETATSSSGSFNTNMVILNSGNVGIGTSAPTSVLYVQGNASNPSYNLLSVASSTGTQLFTVTPGGNVGIGITAPTAGFKLDVQDTLAAIQIKSTTGTNGAYFQTQNTGGTLLFGNDNSGGNYLVTGGLPYAGVLNMQQARALEFGTNNTVRVTIDSTGNVGIGTTSPLAKLDVYGNLNVATSSTSVLFANTGTSRVGIGTSTPADTLHIITTSAFAGLTVQSTNDVGVSIKSQAGNGAVLTFPTQGVHLFARANSGNLFIGNSGGVVEMIGVNGSVSSPNSVVIGRQGAAQSIGNGTLLVYDATASTGITTLNLQEGAGQGATSTLNVLANNGTTTRFTIQGGTGNVGIGTISPTSLLSNNVVTTPVDVSGIGVNASGLSWYVAGQGYAATLRNNGSTAVGRNVLFLQAAASDNASYLLRAATTAGTEALSVTAAGNVGIGTSTPNAGLHIGSNTSGKNVIVASGWLCVDDNDSCTGATASGTVYAVNAYTTGADVAENYPTLDADLEAGDVVSTSKDLPSFVEKNMVSNHTKGVLGVISTKPGVLLNGYKPVLNPTNSELANAAGAATTVPVALAGRVPVKVTNENGNIQAGDFLTASKQFPGYAMKATQPGQVFGRALESFSSSVANDQAKILVFIQFTYYQPSVAELLQGANEGLSQQDQTWLSGIGQTQASAIGSLAVLDSVYVQKDLHVQGVVYAADIRTDTLTTKTLCLEDVCVTKEQLKKLLDIINEPPASSGNTGSGNSGNVEPPVGGENNTEEPGQDTPLPTSEVSVNQAEPVQPAPDAATPASQPDPQPENQVNSEPQDTTVN